MSNRSYYPELTKAAVALACVTDGVNNMEHKAIDTPDRIEPPAALALGCNTPHGINVLSDWIEERTGHPPDFEATGWSDGNGNGNGDGDGYGFGDGYGYGDGDGYGDGNGFGDGYGFGNGDGYGFGYGY